MLKTIGITVVAMLFSAATAVAQINIPPELEQPPTNEPPPAPEPDPVVEPDPAPEPEPAPAPEPEPAPEAGKDCKHRHKAKCDDEARRQAILDRIELHKQRMRERQAKLKAALEAAKKRHCRK